MNWMSKHSTEHRANLLNEMPIDDHASKGPKKTSDAPLYYPNKKMAKVEDKLTILGGDPAFPSPPDMSKPRNKRFSKRVESWSDEKKNRKKEKFQDLHQRQFEAFEYGQKIPNRMEGPLDKGCAKSEGGPGCVQKRGNEYVIINNKKPGNQVWRGGFASKAEANKVLSGYHANK